MKKVFFSWLLCISSDLIINVGMIFLIFMIRAIFCGCPIPFIVLIISAFIIISTAIIEIVLTIKFARSFICLPMTRRAKIIYYSVAFLIILLPYILLPDLYLGTLVDLWHQLIK
ncbi:MAG TPA: hypothetical protein PKI60_01110 [Oscillospiraceae bacterium]|nr:hypothetical protein [Oscillospiraceae bacterium]